MALHLLGGVGVLGFQVLEEAHHGLGTEDVVLHDGLVGNPHEGQDQCREDPGPVLAGTAVEHRRKRAGRPEDLECPGEGGRTFGHHPGVAGGHEGCLPPRRQLFGGREHVGERQVDVAHRHLLDREPAPLLGLVHRAQVDDRGHAQIDQPPVVGFAQSVEPVGPEQAPPAGLVAVIGPVAPQITEVDAPVEGQGPGWARRRRSERGRQGVRGHGSGAYRLSPTPPARWRAV